MDAERSERKPAGSDLPAWARKARGINADKPEVKTVSFDEMWTYLGVRRGENRQSVWIWTAVEVNRNERLHLKLRVRLNRLVRRTHGYGKRLYMLVGSLAMAPLREGLHQRQRV